MKIKQLEQITNHGTKLLAIFTTAKEQDPVKLCKKLRRLENKAHQLATNYCNGEKGITSENWEGKCQPILSKVKDLLNTTDNYPIFINGDARGYALKISDRYVKETGMNIHTDWGGYGILAPEF